MWLKKGDFVICQGDKAQEYSLIQYSLYVIEDIVEQDGKEKVKLSGVDGFFPKEIFVYIDMRADKCD